MPVPGRDEATRPKLVSIQEPGSRPGEPAGSKSAFGDKMVGRIGWAVFALLFVLAIGALGIQTRRVETLAGEVGVLQQELDDANQRLDVYQAKISYVRDSLSDVLDELTTLRELVDGDDLPPPAEEPPPSAD